MARAPRKPERKRGNLPPLSLHVPEPHFRPGDKVDYSWLAIPPAGAQPRPDEGCVASETHPLCLDLIRVLGDDHLLDMARAGVHSLQLQAAIAIEGVGARLRAALAFNDRL